jgi:hypothetical protein
LKFGVSDDCAGIEIVQLLVPVSKRGNLFLVLQKLAGAEDCANTRRVTCNQTRDDPPHGRFLSSV